MSKFTKEELEYLEKHVIMDKGSLGIKSIGCDIGYVKGDIDDVTGEIGCVEGFISNVVGDIGDVKGDIYYVKGDIYHVKGDINKVEGDIIDSVEGDVKGSVKDIAKRMLEEAEANTIKHQHLPTDATERKQIPIYTGFINYFPDAIAAVSKLSLEGALQHGQTAETLHWDRSKSGDELDALMRHLVDEDWVQVAWRAMANLQKQIELEKEECNRVMGRKAALAEMQSIAEELERETKE